MSLLTKQKDQRGRDTSTSEGHHHHLCISSSLSIHLLQIKGEPAHCWLRYLKSPLHSTGWYKIRPSHKALSPAAAGTTAPCPSHKTINRYTRRDHRHSTQVSGSARTSLYVHTCVHMWTELVTHQITSCCSQEPEATLLLYGSAEVRGSRSWVLNLRPRCPHRSSQLEGA